MHHSYGHGFPGHKSSKGSTLHCQAPPHQPTLNTPYVLTTVAIASQTWHTSTTPAAPILAGASL